MNINKKEIFVMCMAWLFPGLGHYILGQKRRAYVLGGVILFMYVYGIFLHGQVYTPGDQNVLFQWGALVELGLGPLYVALALTPFSSGVVKSFTFEFGTSFLITAALLNYFAIIDVLDVMRGRHEVEEGIPVDSEE
ncbi:MAG: hypothetical protein DRJ14_03395 [Acidobacteria bacterium]|nr:MAG: hypothetical protein DRJ14_03395 [Acidobacteriota bacterium]